MAFLLLLIVAVAAFNIVSSLVMVVKDKTPDIAILRTLGASPKGIMGIFWIQGTLIGVIGTLAGVALGVTIALFVPFFTLLAGMLRTIFQVQYQMHYVFIAEVVGKVVPVLWVPVVDMLQGV